MATSKHHDLLNKMKTALNRREQKIYSEYAAFSHDAIRRQPEDTAGGYRQSYALDADRIMHSRAYTRYIDKTQVFYLIRNDHITHRVLHVQLVSKIARTIGRFLQLNEDLIEAIALGHDIGHAPFGHDGERFLSRLCEQAGIGSFQHNIQSIQFLEHIERDGKGWNLSLQTLDGILCHDGEIHNQVLQPAHGKNFDVLDSEVVQKRNTPEYALMPMTLEGCVVRMADTIAYIGRDLEDAIRLGVIDRRSIPPSAAVILGSTNGTIVYSLVTDIIAESQGKPYITFSRTVSEALWELKRFNLEKIYLNPRIKRHTDTIQSLFERLFDTYATDLEHHNDTSAIYKSFLADMCDNYTQTHSIPEIVRDFIAGMTDHYFLRQCPEHLRPDILTL